MGVICSTSQCELLSTFPNLRVTNVIRIVTFYTLPPLESPTSSWMTRSQRSRRRDIAKTPLQSRVRPNTHLVVMNSASQCTLRCPFRNVRVTNVISIMTYYTLPPRESSDSFWMTRSQRSRRRDKGLGPYRPLSRKRHCNRE